MWKMVCNTEGKMLLFKYEFKNFISFIEILPLDALLGPLDTSVKKNNKDLVEFSM